MIRIQNGHRSTAYYFNELKNIIERIIMNTAVTAPPSATVKPTKTKVKKIRYSVLRDSHVYVVLEHATGIVDAKVHGVYSTKQSAEGKKAALTAVKTDADGHVTKEAVAKGYVCVLTEHLKGAKVKHTSSSQGRIIIVR